MRTYICENCQYVYDPSEGDDHGGIAPGIPFRELPRSWKCPGCKGAKSEFVALGRDFDGEMHDPG